MLTILEYRKVLIKRPDAYQIFEGGRFLARGGAYYKIKYSSKDKNQISIE